MIDTRNWRIGTHYGIHGYAENGDSSDDEPIFTAMSKRFANQIIADHNSQKTFRTEIMRLLEENEYLTVQLSEANNLIAKLRGNALRTIGSARRAYSVLGEVLQERAMSTPDTTDAEAACE